jgi:hypothetical protein
MDGDLSHVDVRFDEAAQWLVLKREAVNLLFNFSKEPSVLEAPAGGRLLLASDAEVAYKDATVRLPGHAFAAVQISAS